MALHHIGPIPASSSDAALFWCSRPLQLSCRILIEDPDVKPMQDIKLEPEFGARCGCAETSTRWCVWHKRRMPPFSHSTNCALAEHDWRHL